MSAMRYLQQESSWLQHVLRSPMFTVFLLVIRALFAGGILAYCGFSNLVGDTNISPIVLYSFGAVIGGVITVSLTQQAQAVCMQSSGPNMDQHSSIPCPLA